MIEFWPPIAYAATVNELPADVGENLKRVIISDDDDGFVAEYDNNIGTKNTMRLEASSYEDAVDEIKDFLGINGDRDESGTLWEID
jgi:hypothetical protein